MTTEAAGASPVERTVRLDPVRLAFEDWADERWGREAYRHKSDTSGEWEAWKAATARERHRCARDQAERSRAGCSPVPLD